MIDNENQFNEPQDVKDVLIDNDDTVLNLVEDEKEDTSNANTPVITNAKPHLVGKTLSGNIVIRNSIGTGGMSTVFEGWHAKIDRKVAVKVMNAQLLSNENALLRFNQEAQAVGKLDHPGIVKVHDFAVSDDGLSYLIMDYIDGVPLDEEIDKNGSLEVSRAVSILKQACDAIQHAHNKDVIHRDLKPSNFMLTKSDEEEDIVKVLDFGIAKVLPKEGDKIEKLTQTGCIFGSPSYMSPEQCAGEEIDKRADIYSMGCMIYECFTGEVPFKGTNVLDTFYRHTNDMPESVSKVNSSLLRTKEIDAIILKAMAKEPEDRYQSMLELKADLESLEQSIEDGSSNSTLSNTELKRRKKKAIGKTKETPNLKLTVLLVLSIAIISIVGTGMYFSSQKQPKLWNELYLEGQKSFDKGDYENASALFKSALQKGSNDRTKTLPILRELSDIERAKGHIKNEYQKELEENKKEKSSEIAKELYKLTTSVNAPNISDTELLRLANDINDKCLQLPFNQSQNSKLALDCLTNLKTRLEKAGLSNSVAYARSAHNSAYWYYFKADLPEAKEGYSTSIKILSEKFKSDKSVLDYLLKSIEWLARVEINMGQPDLALEQLNQRMSYARKANSLEERKVRIAQTRKLLSEFYLLQKSDFTKAEENIHDAIRTYEELSLASEDLAECYAIQGIIFQKSGNLKDAEVYFKKAVNAFEQLRVRYSHYWVKVLASLGDVLMAQNSFDLAEGYYRRSLVIGLRFMPELTYNTDHVFDQLTRIKELQNKKLGVRDENKIVGSIIPLAKLRLEVDRVKHGESSWKLVNDYITLSTLARRGKNFKEANQYLETAWQKLTEKNKNSWMGAKLLIEKSKLAFDNNNRVEGENLLEKAVRIFEAHKDEISKNQNIYKQLEFEVKFRIGKESDLLKRLNILSGEK